MTEQSTTPDLVQLTRRSYEAGVTFMVAVRRIDEARAAAERLAQERG